MWTIEKMRACRRRWRVAHLDKERSDAKARYYADILSARMRGRYDAMKRRCYNANDAAFKNYGGRGITVCPRWRNSYKAFREDMGPCPSGYSLDRIDNSGGYSPENCRWATKSTQAVNRRPKRFGRNNQFTVGRI